MVAKVIKGFINIFIKLLARKKKVCIFALGFTVTSLKPNETNK